MSKDVTGNERNPDDPYFMWQKCWGVIKGRCPIAMALGNKNETSEVILVSEPQAAAKPAR